MDAGGGGLFDDGFLRSLGQGFQAAGGILNPDLAAMQQKNYFAQQQDVQKEQQAIMAHLIQSVQNGSGDPAQMKQALIQMGMPQQMVAGLQPSAKAQMELVQMQQAQDAMKSDEALTQKMKDNPITGPEDLLKFISSVGAQNLMGPKGQNLFKIGAQIQSRKDNLELRYDALAQRADEMDQRADDKSLDRASREKIAADSLALRAQMDQIHTSLTQQGFQLRRDLAAMAHQGIAGAPSAPSDLHGDEFLKTLPADVGGLVKAIDEGRMSVSALGYRSEQRAQILKMVSQYNPQFDLTLNTQRAGVRKSFTSGPDANNVTAINTAIGHMQTYQELMDAQANGDIQRINAAVNRVKAELGKPEVTAPALAVQAIGDELMRTFRQVNANQQEAEEWRKKFDTASSPAQALIAAKTGAKLLESRIIALDDKWKRGMRTDEGFPDLLSPTSQAALRRLGLNISAGQPKQAVGGSGYQSVDAFKADTKGAASTAIPQGSVKIGKTPDGRTVYRAPNGKQYAE